MKPDFVLHLGVDTRQAEVFHVESTARRNGYCVPDVDGKLPSQQHQPAYWPVGPASLKTLARLEDVIRRWQSEAPVSDGRWGR